MKQQQTEDAEDRRKRSTKKRGTDRKAERREEVLGKGGEKKPRAHMREQRAATIEAIDPPGQTPRLSNFLVLGCSLIATLSWFFWVTL